MSDKNQALIKKELSNTLSKKDMSKLIDLYFEDKNWLYRHQYESFHHFIEDIIFKELKDGNHVFHEDYTKDNKLYRHKFVFSNILIKPPTKNLFTDNEEYMFPEDARRDSLSYESRLLVTAKQVVEIIDILTDKKEEKQVGEIQQNVPIAKIPIMVKSKFCTTNLRKGEPTTECRYDPGGYFIISGSEKVIISQERMCENKIFIFTKKDPTFKKGVMYTANIDCRNPANEGMLQKVVLRMRKDETITVSMGQLVDIPLFIFFRGLGLSNDADIIKYCVHDENDQDMINILKISSSDSVLNPAKPVSETNRPIRTQEDAIKFMVTKLVTRIPYNETDKNIKDQQRRNHLMKVLTRDFFAHISEDLTSKIQFLGYMVYRLLNVYIGREEPDDRDSYTNKRVDTPGVLLGQLFRQHFRKLLNDCTKFFKKKNQTPIEPINIISQIKETTIENGIKSGLMTGTWGIQKKKTGVAQVLSRLTYIVTLSYLRRVVTPGIDATNKVTAIRHVNNIQYGFIDVVESPDGASVGIVKHLSLSSSVTLALPSQVYIIKNLLIDSLINLNDVPVLQYKKMVKVFLNGEWLGMSTHPKDLVDFLEEKQMNGLIDKTVSIVLDYNMKEIKIYTDGGRLYRPLLKVKDNELVMKKEYINEISFEPLDSMKNKIVKWNDFLTRHPDAIQYIDMEKSEFLLVAMNLESLKQEKEKSSMLIKSPNESGDRINRYDKVYKKYTHCELHEFLQLGIISGTIPFAHHNQSPRLVFFFAQVKQAMGLYATNWRHRLDISYMLYNTQTPLTMTRTNKYINMDQLPAGENIVVAVACYTG